ncbi:CU044_2847 family protein [Streptomyces sp. NPDC047117]
MLDTVRPVAESFVGRFRGPANAPDESTLEFGVSLSAEADVVIASTATAANFSVSLTWNRSDGGDANRVAAQQG